MKIKQKKDAVREKHIKKTKLKSKLLKPPQKEKVAIVAQEFKYSRLLAGNEKKTRDKVLKALKKWLINCFEKGHEFKEDDFARLWKGLFYAVWMADKPLVQEELCESISGILDSFPAAQFSQAMLFFKAGLRILATEWYGIDHHRMDKFLMLVRRLLRASFRSLKTQQWDVEACEAYVQTLGGSDGVLASKTPVYARNALSMLLHIAECYLEELSKISNGSIKEDSLVCLLKPFSHLVLFASDLRLCVGARRLFTTLLRQSERAIEGSEKQLAWQRMGCPEGGPEALEPVSDDEEQPGSDEDESGDGDMPLDPRAGRVDVILSPLPVPAVKICKMLTARLKELASVPGNSVAASATRIKAILKRFEALSRDENPLPCRAVPTLDPDEVRIDRLKSALELADFERTAVRDPVKEVLKGVGRRERKRLLSLARSGLDVSTQLQQLTEKTSNGEWQVAIENTQNGEPNNKQTNKKRKMAKEDSPSNKKVKLIVKNKNLKPSSPKISQINQSVSPSQSLKPSILNGDAKTNEKVKNYNKQDKVKLIVKQNKLKTKNSSKNQVTRVHGVENKDSPLKTKDTSPKIRIISKESPLESKVGQKNLNVGQNNLKVGQNNPKVGQNNPKAGQNNPKTGQRNAKISQSNAKLCQNDSKLYQTPKKVKFVLKNNSMQKPLDYFKSVRQSPNIPFDGTRKPVKTNLKPSTPSPINPFFKKKLRLTF